jgi:hypothetical protein
MVGHFSFINNLNFIIMNFNFQGTDVVPFNQPATTATNKVAKKPFLVANTEEVSLSFLKNKCIIPNFSKDGEAILSHQEFIDTTWNAIKSIFPSEVIEEPEIRVSHQIKGRTPDAMHIPVKDMQEHQMTIFYERAAFIIRIPSITETINGNTLSLTVGGVRALNTENLYNKKTYEKFKVFIGFNVHVCANLCISTDGFKDELKAMSAIDLEDKILQLFTSYNMHRHIHSMEQLTEYSLSETQFAQLIGKSRLYNFLPKKEKLLLPELLLTDGHITTVAKDYYQDKSFCKDESGDINLWKFYNLLTGSNKSSYVDTFLDRGVNAFHFTEGISHALNDRTSKHAWFIQ